MLFVVPDRVVVVVDDVVVCNVGDGEDDLVAVAEPLPVPTIFTGFSLVGRARTNKRHVNHLCRPISITLIPVELLFDDSFAVIRLAVD